jgi:arginine decarboxylase
MKTPLYSALTKYSREKIPFHMPGHKFGRLDCLEELNLFGLDATEASGLDNLYASEGIIKEAMELMAEYYGADNTLFLTNGSTAGILASLLALCKEGDKILVARNAHYSAWHGLILSGAVPIYIEPEWIEEAGVIGKIIPQTVEIALQAHPDCKGAIIVSPTYEGIVSDVEEIAKILHAQGKALIVDEAHGAHFVCNEAFPTSATRQGADVVIHSMHKTLPTLTQSGLLHWQGSLITQEKLIKSLQMVQTSSPSYAMMGLMDYVRGHLIENKEQIANDYIAPLKTFRQKMRQLKVLCLFELSYDEGPYDFYDPGKVIVLTKGILTGAQLAQMLEEEYEIVVEAALPHYIILMTSLVDTQKELEYLEKALIAIDLKLSHQEMYAPIHSQLYQEAFKETIPLVKSPREVYFSDTEKVSIEKANQRVLAKNIMLYPPGIPLFMMGQRLRENEIETIKKYKEQLLGLEEEKNSILVIKE